MRMFVWNYSSAFPACLVLIAALAVPGRAAVPQSAPSETTTITAQKMTVRNQENQAIFEGSVVLTRGALVVHSDTMIVSFKPAEQTPPSKKEEGKGRRTGPAPGGEKGGSSDLPTVSNRAISTIEALGRVVIEKAEGRATCTKAVYYGDEEKIVLTGKPVAWQKGARVSGKRITMFLAEDRSVVEGESRVMLRPDAEGGGG